MSPVRMDHPGLGSFPSASTSTASKGPMPFTGQDEANRIKMEAFRKVKPTCVELMSLTTTPPTSTSPHARLLSSLLTLITPLPSSAFTQSMINYLLFPLTQTLRSASTPLPENFLEAAFRLLGFLVPHWRVADGGMDPGAWEHLWRFTIASVGPAQGKGKGKEMGQEVHLEAIRLLGALLSPSADGTFPNQRMKAGFADAKAPLMSTLFQTISYLLSQIWPVPPHRQLQLSALTLLRPLIGYLRGQHPVLASLLPGTVSGVAKLFGAEGRGMKGDVGATGAGLVQDVLQFTLSDEDLRDLGVLRGKVDDLSQLAEEWDGEGEQSLTPPIPASPAPSSTGTGGGGGGVRGDPFPPLSKSYLAFTSSQLYTALPSLLSTLYTHPSEQCRSAAAALSHSILEYHHESLPGLIYSCTRTLLLLSQDPFDPVRFDVQDRLRRLLSTPSGAERGDMALVDILSGAMSALPRLIISGQDERVVAEATIVTAISEIICRTAGIGLGGGGGTENALENLLGASGKVERWGWSLLDCLEFGRPAGWSQGDPAARAAQLGWASISTTTAPIGLIEAPSAPGTATGPGQSAEGFPRMPFRYLESPSTARVISRMLEQAGRAGGEGALHSVEHFLLFARNHRSNGVGRAASALWVAQQLLDGIATAQMDGPEGRVGKRTRKMAKEAVGIVVALDEEDDDDDGAGVGKAGGTGGGGGGQSDALLPVQRERGLNALTTLIDRPAPTNTFATDQTRRLHSAAQRSLLTCQSLSLLALSSRILSSSFRPLLLNSLYTVLSHLASPHTLVRDYASETLAQIALHTGYTSTRDLILDNVDYIINVVSRRLSPSRLSIHAPLVLIAMIRLVGSEIVPLVHDVVDEIFDALDDYHGYEILASSLLAVLVCLISTMSADIIAEGLSEERKKKMREYRRVDGPPDPKVDFGRFESWFKDRKGRREEEVKDILERAPREAWSKSTSKAKSTAPEGEMDIDPANPEAEADPDGQPDEADIPLTRPQEVCKHILQKSIYFLSHPNPFLRSRVLSLIAAAVPVLAGGNREGDLLPLIDGAWGVIITRLGDLEGYVVTAAAEVIASLAEHCGDYMGRRILDHAWPKFKSILAAQYTKDQHSALARLPTRSNGGGTGRIGESSAFTSGHRLHMAIMKAVKWVAAEVPVQDDVTWEMTVSFRVFLDRRANEEIQGMARDVFGMLNRRDGDMVWVVLSSTMGDEGEGMGVWSHLREVGLDIRENAERVLAA